MARTLASIQKIVALDPIPGADKIAHAQVLGWKCITAIDNGFKVGDLCIYVEIDSRVPPTPQFAFLEKRHYKVKTIKMRGVYSQGLIIPLKDVPVLQEIGKYHILEGLDVTDILGITKIDTDEPGERVPNNSQNQHPIDRWLCKFKLWRKVRHYIFPKKEKGWPSEIPHTDETRIQALWTKLEPVFQLPKKWYVTTKIDGQSATYYYKKGWWGGFFGMYSRELRKKEGDGSNWDQIEKKYDIKNKLKMINKTLWIQGEIAGPGIQKNKDHFSEKRFFIFNIYIPSEKRYMDPERMAAFCARWEFEMVPMVAQDISLAGKTIDDLVAMSNGPSQWSKDDLREGIVIREMEDYGLSRISFKVVSPEFCIKYGL